jgi:hypothetical protein
MPIERFMAVTTFGSLELGDLISPELVLVDPELRKRLARLGNAVPRPAWDVARPRNPAADSVGTVATEAVAAAPVAHGARQVATRPRPKRSLVAVGVAIGVMGVSTVVGLSTAGSGTADPAAVAPSTGQRIAWAPSPGATGYVVELRRPGGQPYRAVTASTTILLPTRPSSGGVRLTAGRYTWYVWSVRHGRRAGVPIVRSLLVVS